MITLRQVMNENLSYFRAIIKTAIVTREHAINPVKLQ